jgi:hypothetical protein
MLPMTILVPVVAIEGNYAIVGAPNDDGTSTTDEGSAYIYRYESSIPGWVFDKKLLGDFTCQ